MALYCIEEAEIKENHKDSSIAKWLEAQGFADKKPDDAWHRVGPWIFVDSVAMNYFYCPHYGCGPSQVFENVHLTFDEFKTIWQTVCTASERKKLRPNWVDRISEQFAVGRGNHEEQD